MQNIRPPFQYQGGKYRFAPLIVPHLLGTHADVYFDVFAGSGAITLEMIKQGVDPAKIVMVEGSIFGRFWRQMAEGTFDLKAFNKEGCAIPSCKKAGLAYIKERLSYCTTLAEAIPLLPFVQAASFGGKQANFVDGKGFKVDLYPYRENRVSFAPNPPVVMQRVNELFSFFRVNGGPFVVAGRVTPASLAQAFMSITEKACVYMDPPYKGTSGYALGFSWEDFVAQPCNHPVFVSEYQRAGYTLDIATVTQGGISGGVERKEVLNYFAPKTQ